MGSYFFWNRIMSSFLESRELRKKYKEVKKYVKIGPIFLTRYEKARIVGARALQISFGAPILIEKPKNMIDPIKIALQELKSQILPLTIRREMPNGEFQDIPISKFILKKD
jgi:DNA-directed RNA polymerases I, II, and III subunit RPABC2